MSYLDYLREHNIDAYFRDSTTGPISTERYAQVLRQSKISLHFSDSANGTHTIGGRVMEVMFSGALLLEKETSLTSEFFTPMIDYVPFDTRGDMLDKVRFYLEHDDERQEIALAGYHKATKEYNHQVFWDRVMAKLTELSLL